MKTFKEAAATAATAMGCRSQDLDRVWSRMGSYPLAISTRGFVLQVADAMRACGLEPNTTAVDSIVSRL